MRTAAEAMTVVVGLAFALALPAQAPADLAPPDYRAYHGQRAYAESLVALRTGHPETALAAARRAAELRPTDPDTRYLLGVCQLFDGQWIAARESIEAVIEQRPDLAEAHHDLGLIWIELGEAEAALAAFERVADLRTDSWIGPYRQAQTAALLQRDWGACEAHLREAVDRGLPWLASLPVDPEWAAVATEPAFLSMVERLLASSAR